MAQAAFKSPNGKMLEYNLIELPIKTFANY